MPSILVRNGILLTMDEKRRIVERGAVITEDDKIVAVGKADEIEKSYSYDKIIDASGCVVMPGLVNTHIHTSMTIQRGLGEYLPITERLRKVVNPIDASLSKDETYYSTLLGAIELIKSGTTSCNDIVSTQHPDEAIKALRDAGIRTQVGKKLMDTGTAPVELVPDTDKAIRESRRLIENWHNTSNGRVQYRLCPEWVLACTEELLTAIKDLSEEFGVGVHTHANSDWDVIQAARQRTGMSEIEYYDALGLTGPNSVFAHCVHVSTKELKILSRTKTCVSYSPVIPTKTGSGIAPIAWLVRNGITVGLGTDSAGLNTNQDLFEEMRTAGTLQRGSFLDPTALPSGKLLEMATIDGAKVLALDDRIGSLEKGKKADIIAINFQKPHLKPDHGRLVSHLVWSAYASDVETTIVDGEIVMQDRILETIDEESVIGKVDEMAQNVLERSGYEEEKLWRWE